MDFLPDFSELGVWRPLLPGMVLLGVAVPVWRISGRVTPDLLMRVGYTMVVTVAAFAVLLLPLVVAGGIVYQANN